MPDKEREKSVESGKIDKLKDTVENGVATTCITEPEVTGISILKIKMHAFDQLVFVLNKYSKR